MPPLWRSPAGLLLRKPVAETDAERVGLQIDVDRVEMGGGLVGLPPVVGKEVLDACAQVRTEGVGEARTQGPAPAAVAEALAGETAWNGQEVAVVAAERNVCRATRQ